VNCGGNSTGEYIGAKNWYIGDAPFVGGIGGFASVFVTASFAYGGTESIAITAGETKNPSQTLPRVVRNVFLDLDLLHPVHLDHRPERAIQLRWPVDQGQPHFAIYYRLHDGWKQGRWKLHQCRRYDECHLCRQSRSIRWLQADVLAWN